MGIDDRYALVVEDDPVLGKVLGHILESHGWTAVTAKNGREALDASQVVRFSLIVTDYEMPKMHGIELCVKLRESEVYAETPIIMITGMAHEIDCDLLSLRDTIGISAVFTKPFSPKEVVEAIKRCFEAPAEECLTDCPNAAVSS